MDILGDIRKDLEKNIDLKYKEDSYKYFKEKVSILGVRSQIVDSIAKEHFAKIKTLDKKEIFALCEGLLKSGSTEEQAIAFDWAYRLKRKYQKEDFFVFEGWLKKYVSNWASCDDFCAHALGYFISQFPEFLPNLKSWANSENMWLRRASAVALIYSVRNKKYLKSAFEIADLLLLDKEDLVQKGYGWMLKEASNIFREEVFEYVMKHKKEMPRTALRYAIEKLPAELKQEAMKRY